MINIERAPGRSRVFSASAEERWRKRLEQVSPSKKIVFTNGCFDLLHPGHLWQLWEARRHGGFLVVGLNSDKSARALKGKGRPLLGETERAWMLANLRPVDLVLIFEQETPLKLIKAVRPDVLVKGEDYEESEIVGASFVRSIGGEVVRVPLLEGHSTTSIIRRLKDLA